MPYKLKNGVYAVRCRHPHCTFDVRLEIDQLIMGITEQDVETEARRLAREIALTKHDAIHGTQHSLKNPEIRKMSGVCQLVGAYQRPVNDEERAITYQEYGKGEVIVRKGDSAGTICQVLRGSAYPLRNASHCYHAGDCFGIAALLQRKSRTADVVAGRDGTRIAFYNVLALSRTSPKKARFLYDRAMADVFAVIEDLEQTIGRLEQKLEKVS